MNAKYSYQDSTNSKYNTFNLEFWLYSVCDEEMIQIGLKKVGVYFNIGKSDKAQNRESTLYFSNSSDPDQRAH